MRVNKYYSALKLEDSSIITTIDPVKQLHAWVKEVDTKDQKFKLLWKGSRDGFAASKFHSNCDGKGPTLTVIQSTDGVIFGGYTALSWDLPPSSNYYHQDNTAFIYSITKGYKVSKQNNTGHSIRCHSSYGPKFGSGWDIIIRDNCNTSNSCDCTPSTWTLPSGEKFLSGNKDFTVKEIEVYSVIKQ